VVNLNKPYSDNEINNNIFQRTFNVDVPEEEMVWHRDEKDRIVIVMLGEGWELQFDESLPIVMKQEDQFFIPAKTYHRIKRGNTRLTVRIEEL
jgi:quercetin dioxygenase-like cupin family protein